MCYGKASRKWWNVSAHPVAAFAHFDKIIYNKNVELLLNNRIALRLFKVYDAGLLSLMLRGLHLKDIEYFSKSDPFYELRTKIGSKW